MEAQRLTIDYDFAAVSPADLITLTEAAKLIPGRTNGRINIHVLQRYANPSRGCPCSRPDGGGKVWIVLPTIYRSHTRFTTAAAVKLWQTRCDAISNEKPPRPLKGRTPKQAARDHQRAVESLRKMGFPEPTELTPEELAQNRPDV
jgi:hypothetical protein